MTTAEMTQSESSHELTAADRCDSCGAQAYVRATMPGGSELLFCAHHATKHREKLTSMGEMAEGTAHHLNTPLAALLLRVQMMEEQARDAAAARPRTVSPLDRVRRRLQPWLAARPTVLLSDEATSALDAETERAVREQYQRQSDPYYATSRLWEDRKSVV